MAKPKKFVLPDWINKADWSAFVKMRIKTKKPMSLISKNRAVSALKILKAKGHDPNIALQFAEYKCNQGIFPTPKWYFEMLGLTYKPIKSADLGNF